MENGGMETEKCVGLKKKNAMCALSVSPFTK